MKKQIILNCVPPTNINGPIPGLSILKTHLNALGYNVKIIYWNILLNEMENSFIWNKHIEKHQTLLYGAYLGYKYKDTSIYNEAKSTLQYITPIMLNESRFFYDEHIAEFAVKLDAFLDNNLASIDLDNTLYFGFSMKMDQWLLSTIIAQKIKELRPEMPIVIGGINTPSIAKAFLESFDQFDFAIWGEGEHPLGDLTKILYEKKECYNFNIANTYYRENNIIKKTTKKSTSIFDLSTENQYPDFDDYFYYKDKIGSLSNILFIEGGRGCHWNKCHFCYLNYGYKHRLKDVYKISQEIKHMINKYGIYRFEFLDNDVIGNDFDRYNQLLIELIKIKQEYPDFSMVGVEIITIGLSYEIIRKMSEAGITAIQIGYESASDKLLKKIDKKNSFASNLNCIKHCINLGISVNGANVIYNLLEETDDDIHESIENLRFFRFIISMNKPFAHYLTPLTINTSSKYYLHIKDKKNDYEPHLSLFHKFFFNNCNEQANWYFFEFFLNKKNSLWEYFTEIQYHYIKNKYRYSFIEENDKIIYNEYFNDDLIESIYFEINDIYIKILKYCYNRVMTIIDLYTMTQSDSSNYSINELEGKIDELFEKGLLYRTDNYNEIIAIVKIQESL